MKKFYKLVSVAQNSGGFSVQLDGKPVKTPGGRHLLAPTQALADAIAAEWTAQAKDIIPDSMPLTQILTTALEQVAQDRATMTQKALSYLDTDLLCYRTDQPPALAAKQAGCWDRWLEWFEKKYDVRLETTTGLKALKQPGEAHKAVAKAVDSMDDMAFTVWQLVTVLTGSLVLGLAFTMQDASPDELFEASHIEEIYKADIYNEAEHGGAPHQEKKQEAARRDLEAASLFLRVSREKAGRA